MTLSRRAKLAVKVALAGLVCLVAVLLAAWAAFVPMYNEWRDPDNIFEELYWSCIDEGCYRAVLCEAGPFWPGEYLPAFLNPCRYTGLSRMGAKPPKWSDLGSLYFLRDKSRAPDSASMRYSLFYGYYKYNFHGLHYLPNGLSFKISRFALTATERRNNGTNDEICIAIGIEIDKPNAKNESEDIIAWITANIENGTVSRSVISDYPDVGQEESEQIVEAAFFDCFLNDYFDAYPESKFDKNDLGQWKWGEIEYEGV